MVTVIMQYRYSEGNYISGQSSIFYKVHVAIEVIPLDCAADALDNVRRNSSNSAL